MHGNSHFSSTGQSLRRRPCFSCQDSSSQPEAARPNTSTGNSVAPVCFVKPTNERVENHHVNPVTLSLSGGHRKPSPVGAIEAAEVLLTAKDNRIKCSIRNIW